MPMCVCVSCAVRCCMQEQQHYSLHRYTATLQSTWQHTAANDAEDARANAGLVADREISSAPEHLTSSVLCCAWQHTYLSMQERIIYQSLPALPGWPPGALVRCFDS
jgi:hypothetical protein